MHADSIDALQVTVRSCYIGEVYTNTRCVVCANGTFSIDTRPADSSCRDCPEGAVCYGSNMFVLRQASTTDLWSAKTSSGKAHIHRRLWAVFARIIISC